MPNSSISSPHVQRVITGVLVALPVLACIVFGPPWTWWLLLTLIMLIGLWEMHGLFFPDPLPSKWRALSYLAAPLFPFAAYQGGLPGLSLALTLFLFAAFSLMLISAPRDPVELSRIGTLAFTWLYVPYLLSYVLLVGMAPQGRYWIVFVLAIAIAGDSGAYYSGMKAGRHKLYEQVSPKKTIEGAVGGLAASILTGLLLGLAFLRQVPLAHLLLLSFVLAVAGQLGDLFESMIKRNCGKKDSSGLLPGHGGVLDRLDSILFGFPLAWFFLQWFE